MTSRPEALSRPPPTKEAAPPPAAAARVLCLGNELLADDALGNLVARRLRRLALPDVEVVDTSVTGFHLFDHILNTHRLVVIDTILTGTAEPGTIFRLRETDIQSVPGNSQHYVGIFEALGLGRRLRLPVPEEVDIITVEAADCTTVGGRMHPAVDGAITAVVKLARELVASSVGDQRCA